MIFIVRVKYRNKWSFIFKKIVNHTDQGNMSSSVFISLYEFECFQVLYFSYFQWNIVRFYIVCFNLV